MAAVWLADERLGRRCDKRRIEGAKNLINRRRCLFRVNGPILGSVSRSSGNTRGLAWPSTQRRRCGIDIRF
jgi:hypothetical protein